MRTWCANSAPTIRVFCCFRWFPVSNHAKELWKSHLKSRIWIISGNHKQNGHICTYNIWHLSIICIYIYIYKLDIDYWVITNNPDSHFSTSYLCNLRFFNMKPVLIPGHLLFSNNNTLKKPNNKKFITFRNMHPRIS